MHKKSIGGRLSSNPVRISLRRPSSTSEETHIPRPRVRSSSVEATSRKSGLKPPARVQQSQYGFGTPSASGSATPSANQMGSTVRSLCPPGSAVRRRSPSAERASVAQKLTRKDNRPLGEKPFQIEMLSKIDSFLKAIDRSCLVNTNGSIKPITLKMFVEVSDLLVKLLDVKQPLTMLNYVEELPKIAKKLHYPGQINKSWLKTANAMHSWPQVLGWLSWLAEACTVRDLAGEHFQLENLPFIESDNSVQGLNEIKFKFLLDAYKAWNEEKSDEEIAATDAYLKKVADMQGVNQLDMENAKREYESENLLLEDAKSKKYELENEIKESEEVLRALRDEEVKRQARIKELEELDRNCVMETEIIERKTKELHKKLEQQKIRQKELKLQINSQPMSISERDDILERCGAMQDQMKELDKHLNDLEKEIFTLDIKLAATRNNLNKIVFAYNKDIYLHFGNETRIDSKDIAMPMTGISNPDIMEELGEKAKLMAEFRKNLEKENQSIESWIEGEEKKLEILEAEKVALESKKSERLAKMNENKKRIKMIRDSAKAKETELKESINDLKEKIKEMEERIPDVEKEEKELAEAKEKLEAVIRRKAYLEESAPLFFDKMFQILANHKNKLIRSLEEQTENESEKK